MVCWKPGHLKDTELKPNETAVSQIWYYDFKDCDVWFIRFSMDFSQKVCITFYEIMKQLPS